jgi:hypothetical protein
MVRWGMAVVAVLATGQGCGGSATTEWKCAAEQAQFPRASISVDTTKLMADLTADERAAVCAEFSRALTDSMGSVEGQCRANSHYAAFIGEIWCHEAHDECLTTTAVMPIAYCTDKMSGMWSCPITIGQYQDCFNDLNSMMYAVLEKVPVCSPVQPHICGTDSTPPSCAAAQCDYTWAD